MWFKGFVVKNVGIGGVNCICDGVYLFFRFNSIRVGNYCELFVIDGNFVDVDDIWRWMCFEIGEFVGW